jgi:hypothetical protein
MRGRAAALGHRVLGERLSGDSGRRGDEGVMEGHSGHRRGGDVATFQDVEARVMAVRCAVVSHSFLEMWEDPAIERNAWDDRSAGCFPSRTMLISGAGHHRSKTGFIASERASVSQRFEE